MRPHPGRENLVLNPLGKIRVQNWNVRFFLLCCFMWPNIMSIICIVVWTPEHRYRSAQSEGKPRPFISSFVSRVDDFKITSPLNSEPFYLETSHTFHDCSSIQVHTPSNIWILRFRISSERTRDIASIEVFCVLCSLFSSKTQDVYTHYFCLHFCSIPLVKGTCVAFYNSDFILFFFLHLVFTFLPYGTVFLACLLVEMNESEVHRHAEITVTQPLQY